MSRSARPAKLGLRFDKVALAFVGDVQRNARDLVPRGRTLIVTITAPIRLPAKTTAVLCERVRAALVAAPANLRIDETINGNRISVRLAKNVRGYAPNVIAVVHNPETPAVLLIEMTATFLGGRAAAVPAGMERVFS
jgi:hypothetical protein